MSNFTVISCYTENTRYEQDALILKQSLRRLNLDHSHILPYKDTGNWKSNIKQKLFYIKQKLEELKSPVVWTDSDSILLHYPKFFDTLNRFDFGIYRDWKQDRGILSSGTMYLNYNDTVLKMLDEWMSEDRYNDTKTEEINLRNLLHEIAPSFVKRGSFLKKSVHKEDKIKVVSLPFTYCYWQIDKFDYKKICKGETVQRLEDLQVVFAHSRGFHRYFKSKGFNDVTPLSAVFTSIPKRIQLPVIRLDKSGKESVSLIQKNMRFYNLHWWQTASLSTMFTDNLSPKRIDLPKLLNKKDNIVGIELGVRSGEFSLNLIETYHFRKFYMIDTWPLVSTSGKKWERKKESWLKDGKTEVQYTTKHINYYFELINYSKKYNKKDNQELIPLRGKFEEFVHNFEDEYFDFIYIDGHAHTGQEKGQTIRDWLPKLKPNGLICGHDYCKLYPLTKKYVDLIAQENNLKVNVVGLTEGHASWYYTKT